MLAGDQLADDAVRAAATAVLLGVDPDELRAKLESAVTFGQEQHAAAVKAGRIMGEIDTGREPNDEPGAKQEEADDAR